MKKQIILLSMISCFSFFMACESETGIDSEEMIGIWPDIIKFSTTELKLDADETTKEITSQGNWWWILDNITINEKVYWIAKGSPDSTVVRAERGRINNPSPNVIYDEGADIEIKKIIGEWFTVTKKGTNKLIIDVTENESGEVRSFYFPVEAGNYFTGIKVIQNPKQNPL